MSGYRSTYQVVTKNNAYTDSILAPGFSHASQATLMVKSDSKKDLNVRAVSRQKTRVERVSSPKKTNPYSAV